MIKNEAIIIIILLVGLIGGTVLGMDYNHAMLSVKKHVTKKTPQNTSNSSTLQNVTNNSSTPQNNSTNSTMSTTSNRTYNNQRPTY